MSSIPSIREIAHFEGHLTPQDYHGVVTRQISPTDVAFMKTTGYKILEFGRFNWDMFIQALSTYKKRYGNVDVPVDFVITEDMLPLTSDEEEEYNTPVGGKKVVTFDHSLEDMRLGEGVASVRNGDYDGYEDPVRRKQLDQLGFVWGDMIAYQRYRFVPMYYGLRIYAHLYGYPMPHYDFIVPDAPQWPYWMAGMPLGQWSSIARIQQKMVEEHYIQRKELLDAMEYVWWIPPGPVPDKYFQPVK